jgi:predicted RND superfamily exporter protein
MRPSALEAVLVWLAHHQVRRPVWVVLITLLSTVPAGLLAKDLRLETAFSELLPDTKPSVVEMHRVKDRLSGTSTLTLVIEGQSADRLMRIVDALSPRLRALGPELVTRVDDGDRPVRAFFRQHKHLYADLEDIEEIHRAVVERYDWEVARATGMDLGLDDEAPPELDADALEAKFRRRVEEAEKKSPGQNGYYVGEDGHLAAILVRTPFGTGDQRAFELQRRVEEVIAGAGVGTIDPMARFGFTGNLITSAEQQRAIATDLAHVGAWGVGLILTVVYLFFLKLRTLLAMALTIGVGCVWAFGVARLAVGYLNTATGFLVSIIAGNGINFGIIYMARYIEARRDQREPPEAAIFTAHRGTHGATLAAAGAAMIAYGSLAITDFHGFKHFGIIGGAGMALCWVATYLFLPAVLVITERLMPLFGRGGGGLAARVSYGRPFAYVAKRFSRPIAIGGLALGVASAVLSIGYFGRDPMEYDLRKVRNREIAPTSATKLSRRVDKIVGRLGQDGRAIVVDRMDQVQPLTRALEARLTAAPEGDKPFEKVVSIFDLLPKDQLEKIALLREIDDRLRRARRKGFVEDDDWAKLSPHLATDLEPIAVADLPDVIASPFQEKDGTRGTVVYIVPTSGKSVYDAHYLRLWAESFREVALPNGEIVRGSGDPVIFTDMLAAVREDAPKAILCSVVGTLLVILLAFRGRRAGLVTLGTLVLGLSWLVAFLALRDIKLNFLNFVALPITVGIGADYALNVMKRRELEPDHAMDRVVIETGGAVVLCSLTTTLGYLALLLSINRAVQSFGLVAAAGELTTLAAAMLVLPAFYFWRQGACRSARAP